MSDKPRKPINVTDIRAVVFGLREHDKRVSLVHPIEQDEDYCGMYVHVKDIDLYMAWIKQQESLEGK